MKRKPIFTSFALLLAVGMPAMAVSPRALSQFVNLELVHSKTTVGTIIQSISQQTGYEFSYDVSILNKEISDVSVNVKNERIENVLDQVFNGTGISYRIVNNRIFLKDNSYINDNHVFTKLWGVNQQSKKITGTVVDATGMPVIGANVMVKGTTNGTITDMDGKFSLEVEDGAVLQVSYIGFANQEIKVGNQTSLSIAMKEDAEALDELVVVGFGTQKKVNLTGSVGTVESEVLESRPVQNAVQALQGTVPGLQITTTGGALDKQMDINIRGTGTIGEGSSGGPLVLIDGMEGDINSINPQDIENISVLKDAAASSIYGSRAPFGVILITTKGGKSGKVTVNYNNNFRWNAPVKMPKQMDSFTFATYYTILR